MSAVKYCFDVAELLRTDLLIKSNMYGLAGRGRPVEFVVRLSDFYVVWTSISGCKPKLATVSLAARN